MSFTEGYKALDIGCGNGRHAAYLANQGATVDAIDISGAAIQLSENLIKSRNLDKSVRLHHRSCLDFFPSIAGGYDLILDSYMSCHLLEHDERKDFFLKVRNALAPGGLYINFGISLNDTYYSKFNTTNKQDGVVIIDSNSRIPKLITSKNYLSQEISGLLNVFRTEEVFMKDNMGKIEYAKAAVVVVARDTLSNAL